MKIIVFNLMLGLLLACQGHQKFTNTIEGFVKWIPASQVFLVDANQWKVKLVSACYKDGRFQLKPKIYNEPFLASILNYD